MCNENADCWIFLGEEGFLFLKEFGSYTRLSLSLACYRRAYLASSRNWFILWRVDASCVDEAMTRSGPSSLLCHHVKQSAVWGFQLRCSEQDLVWEGKANLSWWGTIGSVSSTKNTFRSLQKRFICLWSQKENNKLKGKKNPVLE